MIYTVDEVSDLLSIPRPTLYRYLREYSIPHVRRAGKISIPEESFDRIKEARELHREGLGTASVRRRLREGNDPVDAEELMERLDRISGALEGLQGDLGPANGASSSQETLQTVLKKQDLLISAVSNLTEKMETLLSRNERTRSVAPDGLEEAYEQKNLSERSGRFHKARARAERVRGTRGSVDEPAVSNAATGVMVDEPVAGVAVDEPDAGTVEDDATTRIYPGPAELPDAPGRREKFGTLARRRRWGALALLLMLLLVLLVSAVLVWGLPGSAEEETGQLASDEQSVEEEESQSASEVVEEVPQAPAAPQTVEVPDLVGMTLPEAEGELDEAGLELGAWNEIPDNEVPVGRVVVQGPEAGDEVDPDTPVDLIVSAGPPVYEPEVSGGNVGNGLGTGQYPGGVPQYPNGGIAPLPRPF